MSIDLPPDATDDEPASDAPLFSLFWRNGELNPARSAVLGRRIARDAVKPAGTPLPIYANGAFPLPDAPQEEAEAWSRRASTRTFGTQAATLEELGRLLHPLRVRPQKAEDAPSPVQTRLLPSGGAKYPILTYVALCRLDAQPALSRHIAWYDPVHHGLVPLQPCPSWTELSLTLGVDWPDEPAAIVMLAAQPANMLAKYGERGGRFLLIEGGLYLGALSYQAAQLNWAGCAIGSFHDKALLKLMGLDAERHLAVLAYACGPEQD